MSKKINTGIAIVVGLAVIVFFFGSFIGVSNNPFSKESGSEEKILSNNIEGETMNDVAIQDVVVGTGTEVKEGDVAVVNYKGTFQDGKVFDSSYDRGTPFPFELGTASIIKGWNIGVKGMKVGGKRTISVPPELGYGASDYGPIPANSTLNFEIELVDVNPK